MTPDTEALMQEGLKRALIEATCGLYRVFTSHDAPPDHEEKFMRGVRKHAEAYERMAALVKAVKPTV
jgi:hypothetical protein